jgi:hypothetical protein
LRFPRSLARVCKGFQIKNASVPARQRKKWEMLINCRVHHGPVSIRQPLLLAP